MATKNNPGAFDCYAKADPDEPMFILLGRDPVAPFIVLDWANLREQLNSDPAQVAEAKVCAAIMADYARVRGKGAQVRAAGEFWAWPEKRERAVGRRLVEAAIGALEVMDSLGENWSSQKRDEFRAALKAIGALPCEPTP